MSFERMVSSLELTEDEYSKSKVKGNGSSVSSAFVSIRSDGKKNCSCWICNKSGHLMSNYWFNPKCKKYKPNLKRTSEIIENLKKRKLIDGNTSSNDTVARNECEFNFMVQYESKIRDRWFLDSCASRHLCNNLNNFVEYNPLGSNESVKAACKGANIEVIGFGKVPCSRT